MRLSQLPQVQRTPLPNKFDVTRPRRAVFEADPHDVGEIHTTHLELEDTRCALDLCDESMRGTPEHHHCTG
jgi:hypothetical protein